jgi:hypothetical protein
VIATFLCITLAQTEPPFLYTRADWDAKPLAVQLEPHTITKITIHHTGVKQDPNRPFFDKLRGLQAWSQREDKLANGNTKPQWADIPYHYYIDWRGDLAEARPITIPGDTNTSYDVRGHALVVIEGTFPTDEFNPRQQKTLTQTVLWLAHKYKVDSTQIKGHVDYAPGETDCPGGPVMDYLPRIRLQVKTQFR